MLNFGRVATRFPATQPLLLFNRGNLKVRIEEVRVEPPFHVERGALDLEPGVTTGLPITFTPTTPGHYESQVFLKLGEPVGRELTLVVRGDALLSPADAGVPIPPPPDLANRLHKEQEIARQRAEAERHAALAGAGEDEAGAGDADEDDQEGSTQLDRRAPADGEGRSASALSPGMLLAFGVVEEGAADENNVPVPIPDEPKKPDLPPPDEENGQPGQVGEDNGGSDRDGQGGDEGASPEAKKRLPSFIIAPNSSVLVHSSEAFIGLQAFHVNLPPSGGAFQVDGRIKFPELGMAFGETVDLEQWGNLEGSIAPDGQIEARLVLRIHDPNQNVLDLPVMLSTKMAVGYSAGGRVMFANGIPRDPATGDFKLVGISNIPLGAGSSLDNAPVFLEILGRLEL